MRPRFTSSKRDPRHLSSLAHRIGRQSPGERRRIHGELAPMAGPAGPRRRTPLEQVSKWAGLGLSAFVTLYFAARLLRWTL